ncbi:hypothetical protein [Vagococcus martis]
MPLTNGYLTITKKIGCTLNRVDRLNSALCQIVLMDNNIDEKVSKMK